MSRWSRKRHRIVGPASLRRGGFSIVYIALGLSIFIGCAALGVDLSYLHYRKSQAQKAADAAALAGAYNADNPAVAEAKALEYARYNGYDNGRGNFGLSADGRTEVSGRATDVTEGIEYSVQVRQREPLFFAAILAGLSGKRDQRVGATAVALAIIEKALPQSITGPDDYGSATGMMNLSLYGRYGDYQNGDAYSVEFLDDDGTRNPYYDEGGKDGYDFQINIDDTYRMKNGNMVAIQIFDPDTFNNGGDDALRGFRVDELRDGVRGVTKNDPTNTQFTLYDERGNVIAQAVYGSDNTRDTDMKWVTPDGFIIDLNNYPNMKSLRLNVKTLDGAAENGFNLRAGPPGITGEPGDSGDGGGGANAFDPENGTSITATGRLPINFNQSGTVTVKLGVVPSTYAGRDLNITNFDTDVQSRSITYSVSSLPGQTWPGTLSASGTWETDTIRLPDNYTTGTWTATYEAGRQDTSVWQISASGTDQGTITSVYLIR